MSPGEEQLSASETALRLAEAALAASAAVCEKETAGFFVEGALGPLRAHAGVAWLPERSDAVLLCERRALRFRAQPPRAMLAALAAAELRPGAGLAGAAWKKRRSAAGSTAGGRAPWDAAAAAAGMARTAAVPVFHEGRVAAVLQFYARGGETFTEGLLERLDRLGPSLACLLAEKRAAALKRLSLLSDLHDDVGQTLAGLALLAHAFHRAPGRAGRERLQRAAQISRLANEATAKVRQLAAAMERARTG